MKTRFGASAVLACSLGAGLVTSGPSEAAPHRAPVATVKRLATTATSGTVATTDRGLVFAMWSSGPHTRLEWAVKRPGKSWSEPKVMASWAVSYRTHGQPVLTASSGHRVTAAWLDRRRRVVVEEWSPRSGWSKPAHLSNAKHVAEDVSIASSRTGEVAVAWGQAELGGGSKPLKAVVGVRRGADWLVHIVGPKATSSGRPKGAMALGLDDAGDVTAAWEDWHSGDAKVFVARLKADQRAWETAHLFGFDDEAFDSPPVGLAVQPDGAEMVNPEVNTPVLTGVFTRVGDDPWTSVGDQPFVTGSLSTPAGALVTWVGGETSEDPDGIAGPSGFTDLGSADLPRRTAFDDHIFLASDGTLVDVVKGPHSLLSAVLPPGGTWSTVRTVRAFHQSLVIWSSTMSRDGQVTVLFGRKPMYYGEQSRLYVASFDATPEEAGPRRVGVPSRGNRSCPHYFRPRAVAGPNPVAGASEPVAGQSGIVVEP